MANAPRFALGVLALFGLAFPVVAQPSGGQELLDFVRDAHRAARESIRTCACRFEFVGQSHDPKSSPIPRATVEYWRSAEGVRIKASSVFGLQDCLWKDSVIRGVTRKSSDGQTAFGAVRDRAVNGTVTMWEPWAWGILSINVPSTIHYLPFEQLVDEATKVDRVEHKSVDGHKVIAVRLFFEKSKTRSAPWFVEVHFDPAVNYLVRRVLHWTTSGSDALAKVDRKQEAVEFIEPEPGVFFPERVLGENKAGGKLLLTTTAVFSEVRVNQPLPQDIFRFRYPHNVIVSDSIRREAYRVDSEGNQISPATPLTSAVPPPSAGGSTESMRGTETQEEPPRPYRWVLPASLGVLLSGLALWVIRRRAAARAASGSS